MPPLLLVIQITVLSSSSGRLRIFESGTEAHLHPQYHHNFFVGDALPKGDDTVCPIDPDSPLRFPTRDVRASDIRNAISSDGDSNT